MSVLDGKVKVLTEKYDSLSTKEKPEIPQELKEVKKKLREELAEHVEIGVTTAKYLEEVLTVLQTYRKESTKLTQIETELENNENPDLLKTDLEQIQIDDLPDELKSELQAKKDEMLDKVNELIKANEILQEIKRIQDEIESDYVEKVENFAGLYGSEEYCALDESLQLQLESLDRLEVQLYHPKVRDVRRELVKQIKKLLQTLDENAKE